MPHATTPDGVKLYYEEARQRHADPVRPRGTAATARSWEPQMRFFSRRYRCITYSFRGYPGSDVPKQPRLDALRPAHSRLACDDGLGGIAPAMQRIHRHTQPSTRQLDRLPGAGRLLAGRKRVGQRQARLGAPRLTSRAACGSCRARGATQGLPSRATTPSICTVSANSFMKRRNAFSNDFGSSRRNTRLKVSWLGIPCFSSRMVRSNPSFSRRTARCRSRTWIRAASPAVR